MHVPTATFTHGPLISTLLIALAVEGSEVRAQYYYVDPRYAALPPEDQPETGPRKELPPQLRRTLVHYVTKEPAGTILIDTPNTYLYLVLRDGKALRYGIGVGREGFTWAGTEKISRMAQWPDWNPPEQMIERQPYLPRFRRFISARFVAYRCQHLPIINPVVGIISGDGARPCRDVALPTTTGSPERTPTP
jgi:lipoprotein-anchoring transpeptidase ErfK/SrfK